MSEELALLLCPECCDCPQPNIRGRTRSATETKWGYTFNSVDFFRSLSGSGTESATLVVQRPDDFSCETIHRQCDFEATGTVDPETRTRSVDMTRSMSSAGDRPINTWTGLATWTGCDWNNLWFGGSVVRGLFTGYAFLEGPYPAGGICPPVLTGTSGFNGLLTGSVFNVVAPNRGELTGSSEDDSGCGDAHQSAQVDLAIDLDDEYTDAQLAEDAASKKGEWPESWSTPSSSYRSFTEDRTSIFIRDYQYQFYFEPPQVGRGKCYRIGPWIERFIPADDALPPEDTEKPEWIWDGVLPEGYDPSDSATWPATPIFEIPEPATDGRVVVGYYEDPEDPETFVEGVPPAACRGCTS